jgi:hypothetical protein
MYTCSYARAHVLMYVFTHMMCYSFAHMHTYTHTPFKTECSIRVGQHHTHVIWFLPIDPQSIRPGTDIINMTTHFSVVELKSRELKQGTQCHFDGGHRVGITACKNPTTSPPVPLVQAIPTTLELSVPPKLVQAPPLSL